ncbi:hypothetical protein Tco_1556818 [Tanacetum coccineum]
MNGSESQSISNAGLENYPPMLKKGSYIPWSSRFLRYIDGKKDYGKMLKDSIYNGPCKMKKIMDPCNPTVKEIKKRKILLAMTRNVRIFQISHEEGQNGTKTNTRMKEGEKPRPKEVDIIKKTENQAKMTKLSMEWKRL